VSSYVYFHRDSGGRIFYVGKGTGDRAWSTDRHPVWQRYVSERLGGAYSVEIHRDGLSDEQASALEAELIGLYGEHLVNWQNPGRQFDYKAIEEYHRRRDLNRAFVAETRSMERSMPEQAIARYRKALAEMCEYESITRERGLVASLGGGPDWGDPSILDRLTLCLVRSGLGDEAVREADAYFVRFPSALKLAIGRTIKRRIEKHRS
jgi:hypothetical protein